MALDKVDLEFEETVKVKPTGNDSGFITYSNTINFASKWLDTSGYILNQLNILVKEQVITWIKIWKEPKIDQGWEIIENMAS